MMIHNGKDERIYSDVMMHDGENERNYSDVMMHDGENERICTVSGLSRQKYNAGGIYNE